MLVGPYTQAAKDRFKGTPNARMIGQRPHTTLHKLIDQFDAGIIPFHINPLTRSVSPIKVFDYLARGKPVVASSLPELRGFPGVICADTVEEWLDALDAADPNRIDRDVVTEFLLRNTWETRAERIWNAVMP